MTFDDQTIAKEELSTVVAYRVAEALRQGVRPKDICVIAPHWWHLKSLARQLVNELPGVDFDAPGLSPLHSSRDNFWFKVARLVLTRPTPKRTRTRGRWAREALVDLRTIAAIELPESIATARRLLRVLNGLASGETEGLAYLRDIFSQFLEIVKLDVDKYLSLKQAYDMFFEKAENRLADIEEQLPSDVESFRRLFRHPAGVVVNTCHGVKGRNYGTVIVFGLLRGYIPNWSAIIQGTPEFANDRESKLLYVICSRAKQRLHLIAETGRLTQSRRPYETSWLLEDLQFDFDES